MKYNLQNLLQLIIRESKTHLDIIDTDFNLRYVDDEWTKIYGDFTGKKCYEYFMGENKPCLNCGIPNSKSTQKKVITEEILIKENNRPIQVVTIPFRDDNGELLFAEINIDITDTKKLQNLLIHSEKLSAVGQLAAGIAHEFNNLMAIISMNTQLLEYSEKNLNENLRKHIDTVSSAVERGQGIVNNLMTFAKPQSPDKNKYDIFNLVSDVIRLQGKMLESENIQVIRNCCPDRPLIYVDKNQIEQVILNMFINARHAIQPKGKGTIEVWWTKRENLLVYHIKDSGIGISKENMNKVFNPFFTTKGALAKDNLAIKGTGLGLPICFMIMKNHSGYIEVDSIEGEWTEFKIIFPISEETEKTNVFENNISDKKKVQKNTLNVLVIDDEVEILEFFKKILEIFNCSADISHKAEKGIELAKQKKYDLIFLDMLLPDISGERIFEEIRKFDNNVPIVFVSGQVGLEIDKLKKIGAYGFIQKPFGIESVQKILTEIREKK